MEINITQFGLILKDLAVIVGIPVIRSVAGWANNALKDKKVTRFEKKKLAQTVVRVGTIGLMGYFGLSIAGVENAALASAVGSFFADKLFKALKENKSKR